MAPKSTRKRKAEVPQDAPEPGEAAEDPDEGEGGDDGDDADNDSDYAKFMQQIKEREQELGKYCMVLGHIEVSSDEDEDEEEEKEPSMEQLEQLARVSSSSIMLRAPAVVRHSTYRIRQLADPEVHHSPVSYSIVTVVISIVCGQPGWQLSTCSCQLGCKLITAATQQGPLSSRIRHQQSSPQQLQR